MDCIICSAKYPQLLAARAIWPTIETTSHAVHRGCAHELEYAQRLIAEDAFAIDAAGVVTWRSNGRPPFDDMIALFIALGVQGIDREATAAAKRESDRRGIAEYVAYRKQRGYSAEELAEMRAAFGPGETVVDIFTGDKTQM